MIRIIPHKVDSAAMHLAVDRTLFDIMNKELEYKDEVNPILRTYQFSRPTVVFGNNQTLDKRYNPDIMDVDLVRRDTGGGHMYFDIQDIHFSFIAPFSFYENNDLTKQYNKINGYIVEALRSCGYNASLGRTSIRVDNKILVGSARKHERKVALHQGVILHTKYNDDVFKLLMARVDEISRWNQSVTSLQNYANGDPKKIIKEIITITKPNYEQALTDEEIKIAKEFYFNRYTNPNFISHGHINQDICLIALEYTKDNDKR